MESDSSSSSSSSCRSGSFRSTVYSPLQARIVDGLATLMSSSTAAAVAGNRTTAENIHPAAANNSSKVQVLTSAASSSSRVPLGTLQNNSIRLAPSKASAIGRMLKSSENYSPNKRQKMSQLSKLNTKSENQFKPPACKKLKLRESWSRFREFVNTAAPPKTKSQSSPFPALRFACKQQLWNVMLKKESGMYLRDADVMSRHENLQPRMRSILIDWMIEVSEVYKLHRETLYLAIDFIDRYLGSTRDMPRNRLQLVGVTCLFIAAKIEEIYPPKLREFAFVTDGACGEDEITQMELVILKGLNWGLSPYTPNRWIKTYMQVNSLTDEAKEDANSISEKFVMTQYQELDYLRAMQLMDLVMLDIGSLAFKYSVLSASVIYHCHDEQSALGASGYRWEDISACVDWMAPFVFAIRESNSHPVLRAFADTIPEDYHNIQTHTMEMSVLEDAQARQQLLAEEMARSRQSPDITVQDQAAFQAMVMTPPTDASGVAAVPTSTTTATGESNIDARIAFQHQQSSVFLSPTSEAENSGFW